MENKKIDTSPNRTVKKYKTLKVEDQENLKLLESQIDKHINIFKRLKDK